MANFNTASGQSYTLASSISSTQTTILLTSFKIPVTNTNITMSSMNTDIAYGTIAPGTTASELISFTGVTQNSDGTATLTGVTRGLDKQYPYTESSAFKQPHAGQAVFILSDAPQVFNQYPSAISDETITGKWTFPGGGTANAPVSGSSYTAPTADLEYASKKYVDSVAVAGAPDASFTVKGIVKLSKAPVSATNPIAVGDNDNRMPTQSEKDALQGTSGTPSGTNKYVTQIDLTGTISAYAGSSAPTGWLLCNGQAVSRTTYANLFTICSTTYGSGDGSTTFNVPNLKGKVIVMQDAGQTEFDVLGETGGEKAHTLTIGEMPSHSHVQRAIVGNTVADPYHNLGQINTSGSAAVNTIESTDVTGGGGSHNNLQPYIVLNYIIKAI